MTKLIVNADDFGYSKGVNYGIIEAHTNGVVNSATILMNMEGTDHAIELAKRHPTLGVGIHLTLDLGRPLCHDVPSLVDEDGNFFGFHTVLAKEEINEAELEKEWTAQIEKFLATGLTLTHMDSHHHNHQLPWVAPVTAKLSKKYQLPVRVTEGAHLPLPTELQNVERFTSNCLADFYADDVTFDYFKNLPERVKSLDSVEIMCHPAYIDYPLLKGSSYVEERVKELHILTNVGLHPSLKLVSYGAEKGES